MNYKKLYTDLVEHYRQNIPEDNFEIHHILPKCVGGSNDSSNLVKLSFRAHYIAHLLLSKIYSDSKGLHLAVYMMSKKLPHKSSKLYQILKENARSVNKGRVPHNKGKPSPLRGKPGSKHTEKTKQHLSNIKTGVSIGPMAEETKRNISNALTGRKLSDETKEKIRKAHIGLKDTDDTKRKKSIARTGKKHTTESRRKMSESQKGRLSSPTAEEVKNKIRKTVQVFEYITPYGTFMSLRSIANTIPDDITAEGVRHRINSSSDEWNGWYKLKLKE